MINKQLSLGDRAKKYEKKTESYIPYDEYMIIRIDGKNFKKFTKGFNKPFDENIIYAFKETTKNLMTKFSAVTGFYQSDETTLIVEPKYEIKEKKLTLNDLSEYDYYPGDIDNYYVTDKKNNNKYCLLIDDINGCTEYFIVTENENKLIDKFVYYYNNKSWSKNINDIKDKYDFYEIIIINNQINAGRVQKLVSTIASAVTTSFNRYLYENIKVMSYNEENKKYIDNFFKNKFLKAEFDTRIFSVKEKEEVFNMIMFRTRDCIRNSKAMFAQKYCSHKSLLNKNTKEMIEFCKETTGYDWNNIEDYKKFGILIKKEKYEKETEQGIVIRTRFKEISKNMTTFNIDDVELITKRYL